MEMDVKTPTANFWLPAENHCLHACSSASKLQPWWAPRPELALDQVFILVVFAGVLIPSTYILEGSLAALQQKTYQESGELLPASLGPSL